MIYHLHQTDCTCRNRNKCSGSYLFLHLRVWSGWPWRRSGWNYLVFYNT